MEKPIAKEQKGGVREGSVSVVGRDGIERKISRYSVPFKDESRTVYICDKLDDELALGSWYGFENFNLPTSPELRTAQIDKLSNQLGERGLEIMDLYRRYIQRIDEEKIRDGNIELQIRDYVPWIAQQNLRFSYETVESNHIGRIMTDPKVPYGSTLNTLNDNTLNIITPKI